MRKITTLSQINLDLPEGRLLMAAIAKITGEYQTNKTPDEVIEQINAIAKNMYTDEIKQLKLSPLNERH